jgi:protein-S-isoprenylcysteine O-methyltransferase Ste14
MDALPRTALLKGFVILVGYLAVLFCLLFIAAGSLALPMGWITLGSYALISVVNFFLVDPGLVVERARFGGAGVSNLDRILASVSFLFFYPLSLIVAGLDLGRYGCSPELPIWGQLLALFTFIFGNLIGSWAMVVNEYFSTYLRIQSEREHEVVAAGPYRYVRHPGYAGSILASVALPLSIGSIWALMPACIGAAGFIVRTILEDDVLQARLDGYPEYAERVRHRLIPGVW